MAAPLISICILAGHGSDMLEGCLESLSAQVDPPTFEVVVGGSGGAETEALVRRHFSDASVLVQPRGHPGHSRNFLVAQARGELLLFLDDDVIASPDLLRRLAEIAKCHPHVSVYGGPNTTPHSSSRFQLVQGAVLSSLVGSGPVARRYGARHSGPADERWFTLCNLAVRREAMVPFLSDLVCAEENAMLVQMRARGATMRYEPDLRVFHARRETWRGFARQMFKYGHGRGQLLARWPATARFAYLAPSLLITYLLLLLISWPWRPLPALWLIPLALYGLIVLAGAIRIAGTLGMVTGVPLAAALTCTVHACYGLGVLRGIASHPWRRRAAGASWGPPLPDAAAPDRCT
jgi:succinoglycan biosynthesis protein ExoA